jgi:hypothetical protein
MPVSLKLDHGHRIHDALQLEENSGSTVALSTTGAQSSALAEGLYDISSTAEAFVKVHPTLASDVTTANGYRLLANSVVTVEVRQSSVIGAILAASTATLYIHKVA